MTQLDMSDLFLCFVLGGALGGVVGFIGGFEFARGVYGSLRLATKKELKK